MKAVLYARVSSREQEREGYSIPAQVKLLEEYAARHGMKIVEQFIEAETAKTSGREAFSRMLDVVARSRDIKVILVEKTDRLTRNLKDTVRIYELLEDHDVVLHLVKEGDQISKDAKSQAKFIFDLRAIMAKNYTDNLSEEIKKGIMEKARQGHCPSKVPYGYRNNRETRLIEIDESKAIWVRQAFERYATGQYSLEQLCVKLYEEGMRFRPSMPKVNKGTLAKMLHNIFYTGDFYLKGQFFKGKHPAIISLSLYEEVQKVFEMANKPKYTKRDFAFAGLMTCAKCGCAISAQIKKGKFIYYHCAQGKGKCKGRYIPESEISEQFAAAMKRLQVSDEDMAWISSILKDSHKDEIDFHESRVRELRTRYDQLEKKLDQIYEDKLDGKIPEELWLRKHEEYKIEINRIEESLRQHKQGNFDYVESGIRTLELARNAYTYYSEETSLEQRRLLSFVLSNCTLKDGKLDYTYNEPFDLIAEGFDLELKWSIGDSNS